MSAVAGRRYRSSPGRASEARAGAAICIGLFVTVVGAGCAKRPPECSDETLARAATADAASNKLYARAAVMKALEATASARAAVDAKEYERALPLCKTALELALAAESAVDQAKQKRARGEPMFATMKQLGAESDVALRTGRSLLDVVPQPQLDEVMRDVASRLKRAQADAAAAKAVLEGSGWAEDLKTLERANDGLVTAKRHVDAILVDIRRGATTKCKPRAPNGKASAFGVRARSHDGFALIEAGDTEEAATGYVSVVLNTDTGGCRFLGSKAEGEQPSPTAEGIELFTWRIGGAITTTLLGAWDGRRAWFFSDRGGRWAYDAGKVAGFADSCESVACTKPNVQGTHVDVQCTCTPRPGVEHLELAREVRFSWHGAGVTAER